MNGVTNLSLRSKSSSTSKGRAGRPVSTAIRHTHIDRRAHSTSTSGSNRVNGRHLYTIRDNSVSDELENGYLIESQRKIKAIDHARQTVIRDALKIQDDIRNTCGRRYVVYNDDVDRGRIAKTKTANVAKRGLTATLYALPSTKTGMLQAVADLPPKFFAASMMEGNIQKWKNRNSEVVNIDKLFSVEQRYLKVQQSIDDAYYNLKCQQDTKKAIDELKHLFVPLGAQVEAVNPSFNNISYRGIVSSHSINKSMRNFKMSSKMKIDMIKTSESRNKAVSFDMSDFKGSLNDEKKCLKLRNKIDKIYMKFAGTPNYNKMYQMSKVELENEDQNFQQRSRKPKYDYILSDFFLPSKDLESVPQNILTVPLINSHLATSKRKYLLRPGDNYSADTEEVFYI